MQETIVVTTETKTDLEFLAQQANMSTEEYLRMLVEQAMNKPGNPPMTGDEFMTFLEDLAQEDA